MGVEIIHPVKYRFKCGTAFKIAVHLSFAVRCLESVIKKNALDKNDNEPYYILDHLSRGSSCTNGVSICRSSHHPDQCNLAFSTLRKGLPVMGFYTASNVGCHTSPGTKHYLHQGIYHSLVIHALGLSPPFILIGLLDRRVHPSVRLIPRKPFQRPVTLPWYFSTLINHS